MASSFASQIPIILHVIQNLKPRTILDIGKGFGKYGMLIHEYIGVPVDRAPVPDRRLREQSNVIIRGVDINRDYNFLHLDHYYLGIDNVDILTAFASYRDFDLVLMCDIIEHLPREGALRLLRHFLDQGANIIVATPNVFFEQELYQSLAERHVSFWRARDFRSLGCDLDWQRADCGTVYLLSPRPIDIRGFGRSWVKRVRRIARCLRDELRSA